VDDDVAVVVEDLGVTFRTTQERDPTLKRTLAQLGQRKKKRKEVRALDGVDFEVPRGSVFGVIGANGAGKSTLFRVLAGIYPPSTGRVEIRGRLTPLLTLGVGFNPELTGRDNIVLGGLANGFTLEQVKERREAIIEFADIGEAIDSPMRTYSSGMGGRLGFSIAAHLDPDILLIDEALAAGDARFKAKSTEAITDLCMRDATVMVISHGMGIIKKLADQALWLDSGKVKGLGPAEDVVERYLVHEGHKAGSENDLGDGDPEVVMEDF
jgi:ABC-2 type transport system ATP-binding protein/teichoic acid transport system ATP-binding protein